MGYAPRRRRRDPETGALKSGDSNDHSQSIYGLGDSLVVRTAGCRHEAQSGYRAPEKFQEAKAKFDRAGIKCVSYYTATIKDDRDLDNAVRGAALLGSRNITGDATGDILKRIDERCTKAGLTFGIHNHYFKQKFAYESPEDVLRGLAGLSKTMGASLDIGHIASCGYDTVDSVRKLAPHLKMVHLKDVEASGGEVNVLLGKGIARIPEVMRELKKRSTMAVWWP